MVTKIKPSVAGFSVTEILVVVTLVAIVTGLAIGNVRGLFPKLALKKTVSKFDLAYKKVQTIAQKLPPSTTNYPAVCLKFNVTTGHVTAYRNVNQDSVCGTSSDIIIFSELVFSGNVNLASCTNNISNACIIWLGQFGNPILCPSSGTCGVTLPATCQSKDIEVIISNSDLTTGVKAKEIELLVSGQAKVSPPNDKGAVSTLWAKTNSGALATGTGACE